MTVRDPRRTLANALLVIAAALALASLYQREHRGQYRGVTVPVMPRGY